ncbi:MAG: CBS domain-containing protein [Thiogranum sp.]
MKADTTVSSIMQCDVLSVEDSWPLHRLARFLTDNQISGAPVTSDDGELIGVVSLTDIVRYDSMPENRAEVHDTHEYYLHTLEMQVTQEEATSFHVEQESSATVRDLMTPMIFEVDENASIEEAADTMVKGHIHRLFVTNNKKISGVITALDMVEYLRNSFGKTDALAREA